MRGDTCPVASGVGDGTRICSCWEGLAGACRGSWGESVFCSAHLCWGCRPTSRVLQTWNWRLGWERKAARGRLPQSNLGGSCLWASGNPIHLEELEPAAAFPLAICKSVKYSCRATCKSRLTPFSVSHFSSPAHADSGYFSCGSSRVPGTPQIFSLASGSL